MQSAYLEMTNGASVWLGAMTDTSIKGSAACVKQTGADCCVWQVAEAVLA
jgi:hypothetical protein